MLDFQTAIETTKGVVTFRFVRIYTATGESYLVSASGQGIRYLFSMRKKAGTWKIILDQNPPGFLLQYEEHLAQVIRDNLT